MNTEIPDPVEFQLKGDPEKLPMFFAEMAEMGIDLKETKPWKF